MPHCGSTNQIPLFSLTYAPESPNSLLLYMEMCVWIKPPPKWTVLSTEPHKRQKCPIKSDLVKPNKVKKLQAEKLCGTAARAAKRFSPVPPPQPQQILLLVVWLGTRREGRARTDVIACRGKRHLVRRPSGPSRHWAGRASAALSFSFFPISQSHLFRELAPV